MCKEYVNAFNAKVLSTLVELTPNTAAHAIMANAKTLMGILVLVTDDHKLLEDSALILFLAIG